MPSLVDYDDGDGVEEEEDKEKEGREERAVGGRGLHRHYLPFSHIFFFTCFYF